MAFVNVYELKTIQGLQDYLAAQPSAGLAVTIVDAIAHVRSQRELPSSTQLSLGVLGEIREAIYDTNDPSRGADVDSIAKLFAAMTSKSGNPVEEALQFVESLQSQMYHE